MESQIIELTRTPDEIFEYQPDHHHKGSENFQITTAKLLHPAIDFKPEGMVIGFSILVEGDDGAEERNFHIICDDQGFRIWAESICNYQSVGSRLKRPMLSNHHAKIGKASA